WIEARTGKALSRKKQSDWEYLKRLGNSPKVPHRPHHRKANDSEQEAFKKASDEGSPRLKEAYPTAKVELCGAKTSTAWASSRSSARCSVPSERGRGFRSISVMSGPAFTPSRAPKAERSTG